MTEHCAGLSIQREGELTTFGEQLATYGKANIENQILTTGSQTPEDWAHRARDKLGLPTRCPHECYDEKSEFCLFHLPFAKKRERGVTPDAVKREFLDVVESGSTRNPESKLFVNAKIETLDLQYLELNSSDNRPIDLRFAQIGDLRLNQTVLHENLRVAYGTIEEFECRDSTLSGGIDLKGVIINATDLVIIDTTFGKLADFREAEIATQRALCEDNEFKGELNFSNAEIKIQPSTDVGVSPDDNNVSFNYCEFRDDVDFSQLALRSVHTSKGTEREVPQVKNIGITLRYCEYLGDNVTFDGAEFGSWTTSSSLLNTTYEPEDENEISLISFTKSDFSGGEVDFSSTNFSGDVEFPEADFSQSRLEMYNTIIAGDLIASDTEFSGKTINLYGLEVRGELRLDNSVFTENNKVRFEECSVGSAANFSEVTLEAKEINFEDFGTENGKANFQNSQLRGNHIDFSNMTINGGLRFDRATIVGQVVNFEQIGVTGKTAFQSAQIDSERLELSKGQFEANADFGFVDFQVRNLEMIDIDFAGVTTFVNADFQTRTLSFDDSDFDDEVAFTNANFSGQVSFKNTRFGGDKTDFSRVNCGNATLQLINTRTAAENESHSDQSKIDFHEAIIPSGEFEQPKASGTYYDFTGATVGDLDLKFHDDNDKTDRLFEYFRFFETEFDGFDFSRSQYREELKKNNWRLETVMSSRLEQQEQRSTVKDIVSFVTRPAIRVSNVAAKYWRLLRHGSDPEKNINGLESTYRLAKIGADHQGDSDASSKFFQKELEFRRRSHGHRAWIRQADTPDELPTIWERIRRGWFWITNWILWMSSGYGERPKRVIMSSLAIVVLFMLSYEVGWQLTGSSRPGQFAGIVGSFTLSVEMFTAIILGGGAVSSQPIRFISYVEGFVGSFFIALFVLTITRSVRR